MQIRRFLPAARLTVAFLVAGWGCEESKPADAAEDTEAVVPSAAVASVAPSCTATMDCPLTSARLDDAERDLSSRGLAPDWLRRLASSLDVPCTPSQPGFLRAVASALASFELRTLPFTHEVDGKLDDRTRRFLCMYHPALRGDDHACRSVTAPAPSILSASQLDEAKQKHGARGGKSEAWVRALQSSLGAKETTGVLDDSTLQRLAGWQRTLQVVRPAQRVHGMLDESTVEALQKAFPKLRERTPELQGPEGFLPACVVEWEGADEQERTFMARVYETQRVWAAQRRDFVGMVPDAAGIEEGRTAQRGAAGAAGAMLAAARASVADRRRRNHGGNLQVVFGYRSAAVQVAIWEYHFPERYRQSAVRRAKLPEGPHGHAAVIEMAKYFAARTAAPGYSLHNRGTALDMSCITPKGRVIGPTGQYLASWKTCWCFAWLEEHAADYGFNQNPSINEPWHWEFRN